MEIQQEFLRIFIKGNIYSKEQRRRKHLCSQFGGRMEKKNDIFVDIEGK